MRLSPLKHTLAVMRILVGLTQKEMASVLECSKPTIQAIELGKLKMSDRLAELASLKTGISLDWLLDNDVNKPVVDVAGDPYAKVTFEKYQAQSGFQNDTLGGAISNVYCYMTNIGRLEALILRAFTDDKMPLCSYKLALAFDKLEDEFGVITEDHKAVGSYLAYPEGMLRIDLLRGIDLQYKKMLERESKKKKKSKEPEEKSSLFLQALGIQERKKDLKKQKLAHAYTIYSDGQVRPVLKNEKIISTPKPNKNRCK